MICAANLGFAQVALCHGTAAGRGAHHGVERLQVALQLLRRAARLLRGLLDHVAADLGVAVRVVQDGRRRRAVPASPAGLLFAR
jgi:hypothetical protein